MKKFRILIADDHELIRRGLRSVFEGEWDLEICGEACDGRQAVALAGQLKPDVVVLDVGMPLLDGVEATRQIKRLSPETEVLVFTGTESEELVHRVFAAGARACVLKTEAGAQLIPAIKALLDHQPWLGSRTSQIVFESYLHGGVQPEHTAPGGLTDREREIVRHLAEGRSNKETAALLGTSVKTVETQRARIMQKLQMTAFSELVRYAVRNQFVQP